MKRQGRIAAILAVLALATASMVLAQSDPKRSRLPAAVVAALDRDKPGAQIEKLTVESESGIKFYDMEFKSGRGEMDVMEDGTVLDVASSVTLDELPAPVAAVVKRAAAGTSIRQLTKSEVRAKIEKVGGKPSVNRLSAPEYVYEAELAKGGEIEIAADGRVLKGPKSLTTPARK